MAPRLDTPLSKALLASGSLDSSALEEAVQEQLIHGGALDTILLEKGAVDERVLAALLSRAWQTEPVDLEKIEAPDEAAVRALPARMALTMKLCPFLVEPDTSGGAGALHVLCAAPLNRGLIDEVGMLLKRPLVAHVVPEVRLWQGMHRAYGTAPDERFASLLTDMHVSTTPRVDTPSQEGAFETEGGSSSSKGGGDEGDTLPDDIDPGAAKWDLIESLAHLAAQETRDGIARIATSYARRFMPFAAMFGVRNGECLGWLRSGHAEGVQFLNKPFTITDDCILDSALKSASPSMGKPAISPGNAAFFGWLGRRRPRTFLVLPIYVATKTVGALVADGGIRARDFGALSDLVSFAARLGPAFESLLRQRRAAAAAAAAASSSSPPAPGPLSPGAHGASPPGPPQSLRSGGHSESAGPGFGLGPAGPAPATRDIHVEVTAPLPHFNTEENRGSSSSSFASVPAPPPMPVPANPAMKAAAMMMHDVTTPIAHFSPETTARVDEVPAPPPLPKTGPHEPRPITMHGMPLVELSPPPKPQDQPVDGTSPFARNYVAHRSEPPAPPPRPVPVVEDLAGLGHIDDPSLVLPQKNSPAKENKLEAPAAFAEVTDNRAAEAWQGALAHAVERGHQGGIASREDKARIFLDDSGWEDIRYDVLDAATKKGDAISMSLPALKNAIEDATVGDGEPVTDEQPSSEHVSPIEELVDHLEALDDGTVERAKKKIIAHGAAAVPALAERFPGRLRVDPFDPGEAVTTAEKLGPLVDALYALGTPGLDAAVPHLDSRYPAHRYAAVLLFSVTPDPRGIDLLRARLHDQEPRIRQLAADALAPFVAHPRFETVLTHLRERLQSPLYEARRRAVQLLGMFRDVGAVPLLMALLDVRGAAELVEDSRQALRSITLQDFGARARGWERWWTKAKKRSRVDWLIEGLASDERELRRLAHVELAAITGDDFGYDPDASKRARARAIAVFETWWAEEQARPKAG